MSYRLLLSPDSNDFLNKLDKPAKERIEKKLRELKNNPELGKPLTGNLASLWSLRVGDYRAVYQILKEEIIILVLKIGHRKNIYEA
ncbi:MAG: type II toxin-antitoxin system RelE/ParE family toxin [archaeon]